MVRNLQLEANMRTAKLFLQTALLLAITLVVAQTALAQPKAAKRSDKAGGRAVLWRNPGNISQHDLRYGPGSAEMAPVAPFTFIEEDKSVNRLSSRCEMRAATYGK